MAARFKVSKQSVSQQAKKLAALFPTVAQKPETELRRPIAAGVEFITRPEAAALTGLTVATIATLPLRQQRGENNRIFYSKADVLNHAERIRTEETSRLAGIADMSTKACRLNRPPESFDSNPQPKSIH